MPREALGPMSVNMPYPNARHNLDILWYVYKFAVLDARSELFHIGAVDIIEVDDPGYVAHIVSDGICKGVIHVYLAVQMLLLFQLSRS